MRGRHATLCARALPIFAVYSSYIERRAWAAFLGCSPCAISIPGALDFGPSSPDMMSDRRR